MEAPLLDRNYTLQSINSTPIWDVVIIGGGATGLGIAVDAATRGFKTLLLEQYDFAKGTSSRSTKLVHGGVRYLAMGDIGLVYSALRERGLIFKNAPHLAHAQPFIIPCYSFFSKMKYLIGLKIYDWMAGRYRIGKSTLISKKHTAQYLPGLKTNKLSGGIRYYDGQFDDARLAVNLAQTAAKYGASLINYTKVTGLLKDDDEKITGLLFTDEENHKQYEIKAKTVINATGVFVDAILQMDVKAHKPLVRPSQGSHIMVDRSFLGHENALMIPKTSDGRVLFAVPWQNHLLLGTTDTPINDDNIEPRPLDEEIDFILKTAADYMVKPPQKEDVKSIFAGLRPLAAPTKANNSTKEISRDHKLMVNPSGLITITGGKWTTYRKMAEETVNKAISIGKLEAKKCLTANISIHGYTTHNAGGHWDVYGSDAQHIQKLAETNPRLKEKLHPGFDHIGAEVVWAVKNEMARTVEDVLARRLRILFLDVEKSIEMAPKVASIMASLLDKDEAWITNQVSQYNQLAVRYLLRNKPALSS